MKIREGFVSNSSSSSFVISKKNLTSRQIEQILQYNQNVKSVENRYDIWDIVETDDVIRGSTYMDNGDFMEYVESIGIPVLILDRD